MAITTNDTCNHKGNLGLVLYLPLPIGYLGGRASERGTIEMALAIGVLAGIVSSFGGRGVLGII